MWMLLTVAAVAGDALNYAAGHSLGPAVFHLVDDAPTGGSDWKSLYAKLTRPRASFKERFHALVRHGLKKDHLTSAQAFYAKHGGKAIVLARFFPVLRSFAPFLAGVTDMSYTSFLRYNCFGGVAWITGMKSSAPPTLPADDFVVEFYSVPVCGLLPRPHSRCPVQLQTDHFPVDCGVFPAAYPHTVHIPKRSKAREN
jgi:membrane protein YqaA with SNARE-associated domain